MVVDGIHQRVNIFGAVFHLFGKQLGVFDEILPQSADQQAAG